jgi:hypothetical protein
MQSAVAAELVIAVVVAVAVIVHSKALHGASMCVHACVSCIQGVSLCLRRSIDAVRGSDQCMGSSNSKAYCTLSNRLSKMKCLLRFCVLATARNDNRRTLQRHATLLCVQNEVFSTDAVRYIYKVSVTVSSH